MKKRRTANDWQALIEQFQASGLRVNEFCRQHHIPSSSFYLWRKKLAKNYHN